MEKSIFKKENSVIKFILVVIRNICLAGLITLVFAFASGYKFLNILTGSMTPTMPIDTVVMIKHVPIDKVEVGDVVTFKQGKDNVTHRVIEKSGKGVKTVLTTQGDAAQNQGSHETVTERNFVGVVICHFPYLGVLLDIIRDNIIIITVCIVLAMFIVVYA